MSELFVDTVKTQDGTKSISTTNVVDNLAETNARYTGAAKSWVYFDGTGTISIYDSVNVASLTDYGTGNYGVNFLNNMSDANFAFYATSNAYHSSDNGHNVLYMRMATFNSSNSLNDQPRISMASFGDLA